MNVTFEKTDAVSAVLTVSLVEDDYRADVKREMARLAMARPLKGFRPGHVPPALQQKFYGTQAKGEVIDRLLNRAVSDYIKQNELRLLGEPILSQETKIDVDKDTDIEVKFDMGLMPEFDMTVDKSVTIPYYNITVTDEMVQTRSEAYRKRFGKMVEGESADEDSIIRVALVELDENGQEKTDGIKNEKATITLSRLADEEQRGRLLGVKAGQEIIFNPHAATGGNIGMMASLLDVERESVADLRADFSLTVNEVLVNQPAELAQEYFDAVLGQDAAHDEAEYLAKLKEAMVAQFEGESNYRFTIDAENALRQQVGDLPMPDDVLKRHLLIRNKEHAPETIEQEYPAARAQLQWQLIKNKAAEALQITVDDSDFARIAHVMAAQQLAQYGMTNMPEDIINDFAQRMIADKRQREQIAERAFDDKFYSSLKAAVTLDEKEVSIEEFGKLFQAS